MIKIININQLKVLTLLKVKVCYRVFVDVKRLAMIKEKVMRLVDDVFGIH